MTGWEAAAAADFDFWSEPGAEACPGCECCTEPLCTEAKDTGAPCYQTRDDRAGCPCSTSTPT